VIISRAPYRISFVGGGTDLREFYKIEDGQVLSTTIDKYIYVVAKRQTDIVNYKYRINWSSVEFAKSIDDIKHPIVREALRLLNIDFACEITTFADIPANSGLGSSSSFTVALLKVLLTLMEEKLSNESIAEMAANIEVDILGRYMGKQDHYAAAIGGLNKITFKSTEETIIEPLEISDEGIKNLSSNLLLFFTGYTRDASAILKSQVANTPNKFEDLRKMKDLVPDVAEYLQNLNFDKFALMLDTNWNLKRSLTSNITNQEIDKNYNLAIAAGAKGGKLLGAGGGGFLCFYVEKKDHNNVIQALKHLYHTKFNLENEGVRILFNLDDNL
tara:strand:- start:1668 stop:2657 length:990 start_codon:yes stop_codon:yes gene_type:complete